MLSVVLILATLECSGGRVVTLAHRGFPLRMAPLSRARLPPVVCETELEFRKRMASGGASKEQTRDSAGSTLGDMVTTVAAASISTTATVVRAFRNESDVNTEEDVEMAVDGAFAAMKTVVGAGVVTNFAVAMVKSAAAVAGAMLIGPSVKVIAATGAVGALANKKNSSGGEQDGLLWLQALYLVVRDDLRRGGASVAAAEAPSDQERLAPVELVGVVTPVQQGRKRAVAGSGSSGSGAWRTAATDAATALAAGAAIGVVTGTAVGPAAGVALLAGSGAVAGGVVGAAVSFRR